MPFPRFNQLFQISRRYWLLAGCVFVLAVLGVVFSEPLSFIIHALGAVSVSNADLMPLNRRGFLNLYTVFFIIAWAGAALGMCVMGCQKKAAVSRGTVQRMVLRAFAAAALVIGCFQLLAQVNFSGYMLTRAQPWGHLQGMVDGIHYVRTRYSRCRSWGFETDLDLSCDPGMFIHRVWRYHLLPADFEQTRHARADCIMFFDREGYDEALPEDFKIVERLSDRDAVAVRKDQLK